MSKLEYESTDWFQVIEREKDIIIEELASKIARENPGFFGNTNLKPEDLEKITAIVQNAVLTQKELTPEEKQEATKTILGQVTGYGVLQDFFTDENDEITEIFINPTKEGPKIYYSKRGRIYEDKKKYFKNNEEALRYCQRICEDTGRSLTEDSSIVDAWLNDGSRIAVVGFKASPLGVMATIRKSPFKRPPMPMEQLVNYNMLPQLAADLIKNLLVKGRANVGVFGRTDSGKTTFLRSMANFIDTSERVFIGETSLEMHLPHLPNCINLVEVVYSDRTLVDLSQICRAMNRNNPDRAILGEIRGKEIVAASQMASSTSGGFWTTGHAGGVRDLKTRMFGMFLEAGIQVPMEFLDEIIASMFDFIIFLDKETKTSDRLRTLMDIVQVTENSYRSIIKFDYSEFIKSNGENRRWVFENAITDDMLGKLAFSGGILKDEYLKPEENKYLT